MVSGGNCSVAAARRKSILGEQQATFPSLRNRRTEIDCYMHGHAHRAAQSFDFRIVRGFETRELNLSDDFLNAD
jgi:hypothetical protein